VPRHSSGKRVLNHVGADQRTRSEAERTRAPEVGQVHVQMGACSHEAPPKGDFVVEHPRRETLEPSQGRRAPRLFSERSWARELVVYENVTVSV
jgi:hypothetical protein